MLTKVAQKAEPFVHRVHRHNANAVDLIINTSNDAVILGTKRQVEVLIIYGKKCCAIIIKCNRAFMASRVLGIVLTNLHRQIVVMHSHMFLYCK